MIKDEANLRSYVLAELRCAALRARLAAADIDAVGLALQFSIITPFQAVALLDQANACDYLGIRPESPL